MKGCFTTLCFWVGFIVVVYFFLSLMAEAFK